MRFRDILLEYDRTKTIANFRDKLWARLSSDSSAQTWMRENDTEQGLEPDQMLDLVMRRFENADGTPNKKNVRWIVAMYVNRKIARLEDLFRVRRCLTRIEILKDYGYFKKEPGIEQRGFADLSKLHSLPAIEIFLSTVPDGEFESQAERDRAAAALMAGEDQATILYNDAKWKIVTPLTPLAASFYGKNTKWCTTSENGGMFETYSQQGPLFIILDKPNNRRWQFHFETDQFMDERDQHVDFSDIPSEIWNLIDWPIEKMNFDMQTPFIIQISEECKEKMVKKIKTSVLIYVLKLRIYMKNDPTYDVCKKEILSRYAKTSINAREVIGGNDNFTRRSFEIPTKQYDELIKTMIDSEEWIVTEASEFDTMVNALSIGDDIGGVTMHTSRPRTMVVELIYKTTHLRASKSDSGAFRFQMNNDPATICVADEMRNYLMDIDALMAKIGRVSEDELEEGLDLLASRLSLRVSHARK